MFERLMIAAVNNVPTMRRKRGREKASRGKKKLYGHYATRICESKMKGIWW